MLNSAHTRVFTRGEWGKMVVMETESYVDSSLINDQIKKPNVFISNLKQYYDEQQYFVSTFSIILHPLPFSGYFTVSYLTFS